MDQTLEVRLTFLDESKHSHFNIAALTMGEIYPISIYAWMVLKRSLSLTSGFILLIRERNFLCAAPLIRLQIDNLLRFRAAFLVADQSEFVLNVIQGQPVRNLRDRSGKKMTDVHLQEELSDEYPWLTETYSQASGYIHLSEQHFFNTVRPGKDDQARTLQAYIGPDDKLVGDDIYKQSLEDMILVTHSLLSYVAEWAKTLPGRSTPGAA